MIKEKIYIYCDCNGRIFSFLNNSRQETLLREFVIILIILFFFLYFKNIIAIGRITPENYTICHKRMKIREKIILKDSFVIRDLTALIA